jgi:hypothetical protein
LFQKSVLCFVCLCCFNLKVVAQNSYSINLLNTDSEPVSFAFAITPDTLVYSNTYGQLIFKNKPRQIQIYSEKYQPEFLENFLHQVVLKKETNPLESAYAIMQRAFKSRTKNNPYLNFNNFSFKRYNRTLIKRDSLNYSNSNENLFSERISTFEVNQDIENEQIIAQKNQGFSKPVLRILSHRMHGINWYAKNYVIFETDYFSPLHPQNQIAYDYKLIHQDEDFYFIKYTPILKSTEKLLEGIFRLDKDFALTQLYANKNDEIKLNFYQNFQKNQYWVTKEILVRMTPGKGGKPVSIFGANINIGTLQEYSVGKSDLNNTLYSESIFYDYMFNVDSLKTQRYDVFVKLDAHEKDGYFWEQERMIPLNSSDSLFFKGTEKTLNRKNTIRKIKRLENVNDGFFPILNWNTDLKTLIKVNNYEGFRLGIGGLTNEDFSENFRVGGYIAYGTKDKTIKYGVNTGFLLDRESNMWLNASYADDVREVGSNAYLTDERVYSLFEPRLVNVIFFYKEKTTSLSLQKRLSPSLLSELKIAHDRIFQTENYAFINGNIALQSYDLTRALVSLRWSPKSKFLKFDHNFINVKENYPVVSGQVEQYFGNSLGGDLAFTKINVKSEYIINHINNHQTEFALEGNLAFGDVPITHSFHAFPNAPNKSTILNRFSVAGVKSFETMFFSEFFSTRIASLHMKHRLAPFKITNKIQPEMVFISRHAIGDFTNQERHLGIDFNTLKEGYSEAGLELNKIFWGFGLSFAYRYGAYHLPLFEDNIAFKFTFNLKL